jgi:hypothetical protein
MTQKKEYDESFTFLILARILHSQVVYFLENLVINPKFFLTVCIFGVSKEGEIRGNKVWAVWWVGKISPYELCNICLRFETCVASFVIQLKRDNGNFFEV